MSGAMREVKDAVEARLRAFFGDARERLVALAPESAELIDAIEALTMRGGKRVRPALLYAAFRSVREGGVIDEVLEAGAGLELLQSYLLIHDDWMDGDEERRGGPALHAAFRDHHGDASLGASLAILAGDLACAWSWKLFCAAPVEVRARVMDVVGRMHEEVLLGQELDLFATEDVSRMQRLKTGSYTVRGPIALGAALGRATTDQERALDAFAEPLGEAFQMRDDLLGTFGDPQTTGKPAGNDLRAGKRTSLIAAADELADPETKRELHALLGKDADVGRARAILERVGARQHVEERIEALSSRATSALSGARLAVDGVEMLHQIARVLTQRTS